MTGVLSGVVDVIVGAVAAVAVDPGWGAPDAACIMSGVAWFPRLVFSVNNSD